jgi:hypothetical protein
MLMRIVCSIPSALVRSSLQCWLLIWDSHLKHFACCVGANRWRLLEAVLMMHAGLRAVASWAAYLGGWGSTYTQPGWSLQRNDVPPA